MSEKLWEFEHSATSREFFAVYLRVDQNYDSYERTAYTFLDWLSDCGGVFESISLIGLLVTFIFTKQMFYSSLISKIYKTKQMGSL